MKRIAILVVTVLMGLSASANSIHYFTRSQADRTVAYLNRQNEIMIYCGYDYEIETYVLVNEIWAERVNSAYYELWIYGYDAYTGDEVYMPLDLQCVWLYGAGRMYNAAQYLRFRASVHTPHFTWYVPAYHPFTRVPHCHGYVRSYHYEVHRHGWMPPAPPMHGPAAPHGPAAHPPLPPYYMRSPQTPAPAPTTTWHPGVEKPTISSTPRGSGSTATPASPRSNGTSTGTSTGVTTRGTGSSTTPSTGTTTRGTTTRGTGSSTTPSTGTTTRGTTTRGTGSSTTPSTGTTTRGTGSSTPSTGTTTRGTGSSTPSTGTTTRGTSSSTPSTGTTTRGTGSSTPSTGTTTRGTSNTPTRANTGTTTRTATTATPATKTTSATPATTRSSSTGTTTTRTGSTLTTTRTSSGTTTTRKR